ncbi:MAG TPA: rhomboid family intramembrane serine protease [Thermodesulfobacteriota bacterium]|nr:rhomboid family intramembrane serine protease [Thermodesulfobacteriota bacterium]
MRAVARHPPMPVTRLLLAVLLGTFVASLVLGGSTDPEVLERLGAQDAARIWEGEWWRLFTSIVLHAGPLHLLVNGYSLYVLGRVLEPPLGSLRFLVLFVVSGLTASLATLVFVPEGLSVGASGAVFGLAGLLLADELAQRRAARRLELAGFPPRRRRASIIPVLLVNLALGAAIPQINNYAHVGGLLAGFLLGSAWIAARQRQRRGAAAAYALLAALVVGLAAAGFRPAVTWVPAFRDGVRASAAGDWERAYAAFTRAIESGGAGRAHLFAQRGYAALRAGRYDEAFADVNRALALEPDNARYTYLRATIHALRGEEAQALADARVACDGGVREACRALERSER